MESEIKSIKLHSSKELIILTDKASKNIFNALKNSSNRTIVEDKKKDLRTTITLEFKKGGLNQFDKDVYFAALSEYCAGNKIFSLRRLYQNLGGCHIVNNEMKSLIAESVEKLACTRIEIDMTAVRKKYHIGENKDLSFKSYLLPVKSVEARINGQISEIAFEFFEKPILLEVAELKKQLTTCAKNLLDVPRLRNSRISTDLKIFLLERVLSIKGSYKGKRSKKLAKIITFESVFAQCGLKGADKWKVQDVRKSTEKIFEHFKSENLISDFHFERKADKFHSIHFDFEICRKKPEKGGYEI